MLEVDLPPVYDEYTEDGFLIIVQNRNSTPISLYAKVLVSISSNELVAAKGALGFWITQMTNLSLQR